MWESKKKESYKKEERETRNEIEVAKGEQGKEKLTEVSNEMKG